MNKWLKFLLVIVILFLFFVLGVFVNLYEEMFVELFVLVKFIFENIFLVLGILFYEIEILKEFIEFLLIMFCNLVILLDVFILSDIKEEIENCLIIGVDNCICVMNIIVYFNVVIG